MAIRLVGAISHLGELAEIPFSKRVVPTTPNSFLQARFSVPPVRIAQNRNRTQEASECAVIQARSAS